MNAKMAELRRCFESAGFTGVKTVLSSGNVAFDARARSEASLADRVEAAMSDELGRTFATIVRPATELQRLIESDPYTAFRLPPTAKRVVTFLRDAHAAKLTLPFESEGVQVLATTGREILIAYVPNPKGPVFMTLIEKTFGTNVTTRTWDTVKKCSIA
jgi:uncharacterized protein (DUF1697 family)